MAGFLTALCTNMFIMFAKEMIKGMNMVFNMVQHVLHRLLFLITKKN